MVVDFWTIAVEQRSWGGRVWAWNVQGGLSHWHVPIAAGLDVWGCGNVIAPVE